MKTSTEAQWISIDNYSLSLGESNIFGINVLNFGSASDRVSSDFLVLFGMHLAVSRYLYET